MEGQAQKTHAIANMKHRDKCLEMRKWLEHTKVNSAHLFGKTSVELADLVVGVFASRTKRRVIVWQNALYLPTKMLTNAFRYVHSKVEDDRVANEVAQSIDF